MSRSIGGYQVCAKWLKDRKGRTLIPPPTLVIAEPSSPVVRGEARL